MRFLIGLAKLVLFLLFAAVLLAAIWPWNVVLSEKRTAEPFRAYLKQNVQKLDLKRSEPGFNFPDQFYNSKLILVGEIHGAQTAQSFDLALMKHLNEKAGVRWLMAELSYVQAERFNAFLDTGDEAFLKPVFEAWLDTATQWGNQQHYEKIKALRAYNLTLPAERRIRYFGVDLIHERDLVDAAQWLARMLSGLSAEAPQAMMALREVATTFEADAFAAASSDALEFLSSNDSADAALSGVDAKAIAHLVRNITLSIDGAGRYDAIPANIDAMVNEFGIGDDEPLYGFWGLFHVMEAVVNDTGKPLALRLTERDLPFADSITSLLMVYADSKQNMPSRSLPSILQSEGPYTEFTMSQNNPYLMYLYGIEDLRSVAQGAEAAIFNLYSDGSPYIGDTRLRTQSGLLTKVFKFDITPPDQQPAEFIVLIDGSPALTAWEGGAQ